MFRVSIGPFHRNLHVSLNIPPIGQVIERPAVEFGVEYLRTAKMQMFLARQIVMTIVHQSPDCEVDCQNIIYCIAFHADLVNITLSCLDLFHSDV